MIPILISYNEGRISAPRLKSVLDDVLSELDKRKIPYEFLATSHNLEAQIRVNGDQVNGAYNIGAYLMSQVLNQTNFGKTNLG